MGIPRLATRLHHKAEHISWPVVTTADSCSAPSKDSKIAVIDGPGLAFHIFHCHVKALAGTQNKVGLHVNYNAVSARLIAFLDDLEQRGFHIQHIYFDGALPAAKLPTRLARLQKSAENAVALRFSCDEKAKQAGRILESHHAFLPSPWQSALWPPPPFLVSSLIQGLLYSKYAEITDVMPGEADHFCTLAARELSSDGQSDVYIFTNDSDLLVLNTTNNTKVVMLSSLAHSENELLADVFDPTAIIRSVGLDDMLKVAYKMKTDPMLTFESAANLVLQSPSIYSPGYDGFLAELDSTSIDVSLDARQQYYCSQLDPRLSELIYQIAAEESAQEPNMFLPFIVDDIHKSSAWKCGSSLRRLAYSVLASGGHVKMLNEFDRRGNRVAAISITPHDDVDQVLQSQQAWLGEQVSLMRQKGIETPWRAVAGTTLFCDLQAQDKPTPSLIDMTSVMHQQKLSSWAQIHLSAQLQAVLYSYRLLKLVLEFVLAGDGEKDEHQAHQNLCDLMTDFPSMLELFEPLPEDHYETYQEVIRTLCLTEDQASRPRKRAKKAAAASVSTVSEKRDKSRSLANNPFAMLAE